MISGIDMRKINRIQNNQLLTDYITEMNRMYEDQIQMQKMYGDDNLSDEYFNYTKSLRFTRLWELMMELKPVDRNLLLLYQACGNRYKAMLDELFKSNVNYKNDATLRVLVTNARKEIRRLYKEKYGDY